MKRGDLVRYVAHVGASPEYGIITSVKESNDRVVFVRYLRNRSNSEATSKENINVIANMELFLNLLEGGQYEEPND